jgi:hypothetical protein
LKGFYFWGEDLFRFLGNRLGPLEHSRVDLTIFLTAEPRRR